MSSCDNTIIIVTIIIITCIYQPPVCLTTCFIAIFTDWSEVSKLNHLSPHVSRCSILVTWFYLCVDGRSECIEKGHVFTRVHVDAASVKKLKRCTQIHSISFSAYIYYGAVLSHSPLLDCTGTALLKITAQFLLKVEQKLHSSKITSLCNEGMTEQFIVKEKKKKNTLHSSTLLCHHHASSQPLPTRVRADSRPERK